METTTKKKALINKKALKKSVLILRAVNHKLRQNIVHLLCKEGEMHVTDIYKKLGLTQSVASQHLRILREAEIVIAEKRGKFIYYSVNEIMITKIKKFVEEIIK